MMEKDKKASHGEEDDFLQLVMMDYDNPTSESATDPNGENMRSNGSSSDSSASLSKGDYSFIDEMEDADEDYFFSKFLSISNPVSPATTDDASSKLPTQIPPETASQSPRAATAATTKGRPRALRKAMSPEMLAELSMQDPKKAKRIITNRMSAVRAKEKKKLYTFMLEHKIETLQSEAAALAAHLALLQTESIGLNAENVKLKKQTSIVMRQIHFQDSLNEEIRNEIQNLRMVTQIITNHGIMFNNIDANNNVSSGNSGFKNPAIDSAIGTEQLHHNQAPNPDQVDQLQHGVEQMNIRQQYPLQFQDADQQGQSLIHQEEENPPSIEDPNNNIEQNPPSNQLADESQ